MKLKSVIFLSGLLIAMFITGCGSMSVMDVDANSEGNSVVNFKDSPVDVKVLSTKSRFVNGMLQAQVELESDDSDPTELNYKFVWFDSDGMSIDSDNSPWQPLYLSGREVKSLRGLAPNPAARTFKVVIKNAENY